MRCPTCGNECDKVIRKSYCEKCFKHHYTKCTKCNKTLNKKYGKNVTYANLEHILHRKPIRDAFTSNNYTDLCKNCYQEILDEVYKIKIHRCQLCGRDTLNDVDSDIGIVMCQTCITAKYTCDKCNAPHVNFNRRTAQIFDDPAIRAKFSLRCHIATYVEDEYTELSYCELCNARVHNHLGENQSHYVCSQCRYLRPVESLKLSPKNMAYRVCSQCRADGIDLCDHCGRTYSKGYFGHPLNECLCRVCAKKLDKLYYEPTPCHKCQAPVLNHIYYDQDDNRICRSCVGKVFVNSNIEPRDNNIPFEAYNFTPNKFYMHGVINKDTLTIGTENEIYFPNQLSRNKFLSDIYKKYDETVLYSCFDGSIEDRQGIEIITHPMTYDVIKTCKVPYDLLYNNPRNESCGMHIHLSKNFFDRITLFNFLAFIYDHDNLINFVCERSPNRHCRKLPYREWVYSLAKHKDNAGVVDKHTQINLLHRHTVELRMFAQATSPENWLKNVEFAVFLANFCKDKGIKRVTIETMFDYLRGCYRKYPNLWKFLRDTTVDQFQPTPRPKKKKTEKRPGTDFYRLMNFPQVEPTPWRVFNT